jgi:hypothetical protein
MKNRKMPLTRTPVVEAKLYDRKVTIMTGTLKGDTLWTCKGEMDLWCAVDLIKKLRKAVRNIRDFQHKDTDDAVSSAEGPV